MKTNHKKLYIKDLKTYKIALVNAMGQLNRETLMETLIKKVGHDYPKILNTAYHCIKFVNILYKNSKQFR